jgi:type VI protein secretion system component Hcp
MFIESLEGRQMFSTSAPVPTTAPALFEVEDYSFDIEQTLNIGAQSSGAGAGKVTFNPFQITRKIDVASPTLYQKA